MQLLAIVILLQFHTALSAGNYGPCTAGALIVNTSTMSVNAAAYGGAASFQYEIVTLTGAWNSGFLCGNNAASSTPSGSVVLFNSNSTFSVTCGNSGSCSCCYTVAVTQPPLPEVPGCSPGSWVNMSGYTSPSGLNGVYVPYIYNSTGFSGLPWTLPYTSWPPYTNWSSTMTCNMNSRVPGNVFPDGFYNVNNGGQSTSAQYYITLSASINNDYNSGAYWGIDAGTASCGTGSGKITSNLFAYNFCGNGPCVGNYLADPFTSSTKTYGALTNTLGIISSGTGGNNGGALWSTYLVSPLSATTTGGTGINGNTPVGIVTSCIAPLACTQGQYVASTVVGSYLASYSCTNCSAGTYQPAAVNNNCLWSCIPCASGYSTNGLTGLPSCSACTSGTWTNGLTGQASCTAAASPPTVI